eukprot:scaffold62409_cov73-Phaeocystis_antarctica.AAC.1
MGITAGGSKTCSRCARRRWSRASCSPGATSRSRRSSTARATRSKPHPNPVSTFTLQQRFPTSNPATTLTNPTTPTRHGLPDRGRGGVPRGGRRAQGGGEPLQRHLGAQDRQRLGRHLHGGRAQAAARAWAQLRPVRVHGLERGGARRPGRGARAGPERAQAHDDAAPPRRLQHPRARDRHARGARRDGRERRGHRQVAGRRGQRLRTQAGHAGGGPPR